jgi:hypothetical protein
MIYFAQLPTGAIKIGCSGDVETRIGQLEQHYRQPVSLLHTMGGDRDSEREIHVRFAHLRFGKTEQFRPGADLMEFIGKPLLVSTNPEAVEAVEAQTTRLLALRVNDEYAAWIEDLRAVNRTTLAGLFDQALTEFAAKKGFREPPERT